MANSRNAFEKQPLLLAPLVGYGAMRCVCQASKAARVCFRRLQRQSAQANKATTRTTTGMCSQTAPTAPKRALSPFVLLLL